MAFTIHHKPEPTRIIRMGHAPVVIQPEKVTKEFSIEEVREAVQVIAAAPPVPVKNKRGRPKMADKKITDETGIKKISEEDAGTQGAIGSGGVNAPAQEKVPDKSQQSEQGKEE